jgi:hypothetical protein
MKKKYNKAVEARLAQIKQDLIDLKHNKKQAPIKFTGYTQKEANLLARLELMDEREKLYKEIGYESHQRTGRK